jgi:hypothetical protein
MPFSSLRATVRDWGRSDRITQLQRPEMSAARTANSVEKTWERVIHVTVNVRRDVREEWDSGLIRNVPLDDADHWVLFDPNWIADQPDITVLGEQVVAGRPGIALEAVGEQGPAGMLLPGANRCLAVLDLSYDVLLRCEAWRDDELLMIEELTEVSFE